MLETADSVCQATFALARCSQNSSGTGARRPARWRTSSIRVYMVRRSARHHDDSTNRPSVATTRAGRHPGGRQRTGLTASTRAAAPGNTTRSNHEIQYAKALGVHERAQVPYDRNSSATNFEGLARPMGIKDICPTKFHSRKDFPLGSLEGHALARDRNCGS